MEFEILKKHIADVLGVDVNEITEDMDFEKDLGADSLDLFQILMNVEDELGMQVDQDKAEGIKTVSDALNLLEETVGK